MKPSEIKNESTQSHQTVAANTEGVYMVPVDLDELIGRSAVPAENTIDLKQVFAWLWSIRKNISKGFFGGAIIAIIISFLVTPVYKAEVTFLPVESGGSSRMAALMSQLGGLSGLVGVGEKANFSEQLKVVLESKALAGKIFTRFPELEKLLFPDCETEPPLPDMRNEELLKHIMVSVPRTGGMNKLTVQLPNATMTAVIANAYMEELNAWINRNSLSTARDSRAYLENQVNTYRSELFEKEEALRAFQEEHKIVAINIQTEEMIKLMAGLKAQLVTSELEREVLLKSVTEANQRVRQLSDEISALRQRLQQLESGAAGLLDRLASPDAAAVDLMAGGLASAPQRLLDYYRLRRDVEITQKVFELLLQQLALAQIEEKREASSFTVIDAATIPWKRTSPSRLRYAVAGAILGMLAAISLVYARKFYHPAPGGPDKS